MEEREISFTIPTQIENMHLPNPELLTFYKQRENRVFWLEDVIDQCVLEFVRMIQIINQEDEGIPVEERVPIKLYIYSPGGEDTAAWALIDAITLSETPVWTINASMAMSNGLSVLVCGHKRFAMPHSVAMYHSGSAELSGTKEQLDSAGKYIANQDKIYEAWFRSKTNIDTKVFNRNKKRDWYITAEEQKAYGIVDEVVTAELMRSLV